MGLSPATGYLGKWKIKSNSSGAAINGELEIESEYTPAKTCESTIQPIRMVRYLENVSIKDEPLKASGKPKDYWKNYFSYQHNHQLQIICLPEADQLCSLPVGNYEFGSLVDINCRAWSNVYNSLSIKYRKQIEICLQSYPPSNPPIEICESFGHSENKIKVPIDANVQPGSFIII